MKKYFIYFIGIIVIALGVALNYHCGFGSSSIDSLVKNVADILNTEWITIGRVLIVFNLICVTLYYFICKPKDIILPIIVAFSLGIFIDFFNGIISFPDVMWLRIVLFIVAINLISLGVALSIVHDLSPSPFECITKIFESKIFPKLSYGTCKVIIEAIIITISGTLGLIFLHGLGEVNFATLIILVTQGPLIDVYLKLLKKIKI